MSILNDVKNFIVNSDLLAGYHIQLYQWRDKGDKVSLYAVFRPDGGTAIRDDLASESYILVSLVGSNKTGFDVANKAQELIDYIKSNSSAEFGYIENMGGISGPVFTEDNRMVVQLQFRIVHDN